MSKFRPLAEKIRPQNIVKLDATIFIINLFCHLKAEGTF